MTRRLGDAEGHLAESDRFERPCDFIVDCAVGEDDRDVRALSCGGADEAFDDLANTAPIIQDRSDAAHTYLPSLEHADEVVLFGTGDDLAAIGDHDRSLTPTPRGFQLGGVKDAPRSSGQAVVCARVPRLEDAIAQRPVGGQEGGHVSSSAKLQRCCTVVRAEEAPFE